MEETQIKALFESEDVSQALDTFIPTLLTSQDDDFLLDAAKGIARAFEISSCFDAILSDERRELEKEVIQSFNKNVHLLIDKTWVEEREEFFKMESAHFLDKMTTHLVTLLDTKKEVYRANFQDFCLILSDIVYLLFGKEAKLDSLIEYVMRMEPHFGLFCYYLAKIKEMTKVKEHKARLAILIAIVFLAEF